MIRFLHHQTVADLGTAVEEELVRVLACERAALLLVEEDRAMLMRAADGSRIALSDEFPAGRAVLFRETVTDASGALACPMIVQGRVTGALQVSAPSLTPHSRHDLERIAEEAAAGFVAAVEREISDNYVARAEGWLIAAVETCAPGGSGHVGRVGQIVMRLADSLQFAEGDRHTLWLAARYHDLGWLLEAPSRREAEHPTAAAQVLARTRMLSHIADIVAMHHERFDGSGSPRRLKGDEILLEAYVLALAEDLDETATREGVGSPLDDPAFLDRFATTRRGLHHPRVLESLQKFTALRA